jgi:hypothetical protein
MVPAVANRSVNGDGGAIPERPIMDVRDAFPGAADPDRRSELLGIMETRPDVLRGFATIRDLLNGGSRRSPMYWSPRTQRRQCHVEVSAACLASVVEPSKTPDGSAGIAGRASPLRRRVHAG